MSYVASGYWDAGYAVEDGEEGAFAVPASSRTPATVSSSIATQVYRAFAAHANAGAMVSSSSAFQGFYAVPADCLSGTTVTQSSAPQNHEARPASASAGATVSPSYGRVLSLELTAPVAHYPHTLQSAEYPVQ